MGVGDANREGHFNTTHWSVVLLAADSQPLTAKAALEELCRLYWYPLYAFVRRKGHSPHDAQDLTQEFFARFLEKNHVQLASPERGRFRSFLLTSLSHFLVNDWVRGNAQKRGGGQKFVSLNEEDAERTYQLEPAIMSDPESLYDKRWATTVLQRAMDCLAQDYSATGKSALFAALKPILLAECSSEIYRELGDGLGLTEGAVKVALHRLRSRFRACVRAEIAETVATEEDVEEEMRYLMEALNS